jgi:hypothetical protein
MATINIPDDMLTCGYINYELLKQRGSLNSKGPIVAYTNGIRWVVPDPNDKERSRNIYEQYNQGWYIDIERWSLKI